MLIDQYESSYKEMKTKLNRIVALDFNFVIDSKADIDLLNIITLLILFLKKCIAESWFLLCPFEDTRKPIYTQTIITRIYSKEELKIT